MNPTPNSRNDIAQSQLQRRSLIRASAGLGVTAALAPTGSAATMNQEKDPLGLHDFASFAKVWRSLTDEHLHDEPSPLELDLYLHRLATEILRLPADQVPEVKQLVFENERFTTGPAHHDGEIFLVVATMQPGAVLLPHNHPNHIVATTCLSGAARYRHFELPGDAPKVDDRDASFALHETRAGLLTPGLTTHLSRERDNVHTFTAGPEGAVLLDFTIELGKGGGFGMLDVEAAATDGFQGEFEARWMDVRF